MAQQWRRRLVIAMIILAIQAAALGVAYRSVVFNHRTLLASSTLLGTEGILPPYGYPGTPPARWNDIDAGATPWQSVPQVRKAHQELADGQVPLWNANAMLGVPLATDPINGLYNPLTWPLVLRPSPLVWDAWLLARVLVAGLLMTALVLYLGLRVLPATAAGIVYMLSGAFQLRMTNIQTAEMALLPLLVLAAEFCIRRPSRRSAAALGFAIAMVALFGMPEQSFLCLLMGAVYILVRLLSRWRAAAGTVRLRLACTVAGGGVLGILWSLPLVLPMLEFLKYGWTVHDPGAHPGVLTENAGQLFRLIAPHWTGPGPYYDAQGFAPSGNWFGASALLLAGLGTFSRALPRGVRMLMVVTAVVVEAKIAGVPGWFSTFIGNLPILSQVSLASYLPVVVSLAVAVLAGAGLQQLGQARGRARQVIAILGFALALAAICVALVVTHRDLQAPQVVVTGVALAVVTLAATVATLWRRAAPFSVLASFVAVLVEMVALATPTLPLPVRYDALTVTPTAAYLQRAMPSGTGRSYSSTTILYPQTSEAFNIDSVLNLDAIYIERSYRYLKQFVVPTLFDRFNGINEDRADVAHNPYFDALNVEYVLVAPPGGFTAPPLPPDQYQLETVAADGVSIYRNGDAAPRAHVVFDVSTAGSEDADAAMMGRSGFNPATSAVVETQQALPTSTLPPAPVQMVSYTDSKVVMTTTISQPGTLVLADAYYPGWRADVDGRPVTINPVDVALRGVQVPAGTHTVTMSYQPASVLVGAAGVPVGVALFMLAGWGVPAVRRLQRRRRDANSVESA